MRLVWLPPHRWDGIVRYMQPHPLPPLLGMLYSSYKAYCVSRAVVFPTNAAWNHYHCAVNEAILRNISRLYTTTGVAAAGYEYVNIDDCWQAQFRDAEGRLQADPHIFPSGIKKLCSDIHAEGNKFGIYVDSGYRTCQDRPGTLDNEFTDAQTFADCELLSPLH